MKEELHPLFLTCNIIGHKRSVDNQHPAGYKVPKPIQSPRAVQPDGPFANRSAPTSHTAATHRPRRPSMPNQKPTKTERKTLTSRISSPSPRKPKCPKERRRRKEGRREGRRKQQGRRKGREKREGPSEREPLGGKRTAKPTDETTTPPLSGNPWNWLLGVKLTSADPS